MLSTVLFIDEAPVGYEVEQSGSKLLFIPSRFSSHSFGSPRFSLTRVEGCWRIDGEVDRTLQTEVLKSLEQLAAGGLLA